jgi:hypothetical protein
LTVQTRCIIWNNAVCQLQHYTDVVSNGIFNRDGPNTIGMPEKRLIRINAPIRPVNGVAYVVAVLA